MLQRILKRDNDHRENSTDCSGFVGIEKGAVLMEIRTLGDPHLYKRKRLQIIRKLLYLLNQGQTFTKTEAAAVLFPVTNLFQFQDIHLRTMVHLIAKELSPTVNDLVMIVTSSLLKDINSCTSTITYRANAIRLLSRITNGTCSIQTEEHLKEAILDNNPMVSSAALLSAINLLKTNPGLPLCNKLTKQVGKLFDLKQHLCSSMHCVYFFGCSRMICWLFRSWLANTREILSLGVDYPEVLKRQGVSRARESISKSNENVIHSRLCLVAWNISKVSRESHVSAQKNRVLYSYVESCVYHEAEMVALEGFRSMVELRGMTTSDPDPAKTVIQRFLDSPKPVLSVHGDALIGYCITFDCLFEDMNIFHHFIVDWDSWKQKNNKIDGRQRSYY